MPPILLGVHQIVGGGPYLCFGVRFSHAACILPCFVCIADLSTVWLESRPVRSPTRSNPGRVGGLLSSFLAGSCNSPAREAGAIADFKTILHMVSWKGVCRENKSWFCWNFDLFSMYLNIFDNLQDMVLLFYWYVVTNTMKMRNQYLEDVKEA